MALRSVANKVVQPVSSGLTTVQLYRSMIRELPRVLTIYDIDMPNSVARAAVEKHFRKNAHLKDERVINILLGKGYMELEETLLQWKQKNHLLDRLEPVAWNNDDSETAMEKLAMGNRYKFQ
mmetsp:Transcript_29721/g.65102  ORF Transcript_29721/g.65102 Transcript_29721/m.65102 type:complete len:122 (+) Transcript_29721:45-410(+)